MRTALPNLWRLRRCDIRLIRKALCCLLAASPSETDQRRCNELLDRLEQQ